jgi:membrane protease YdiL (CAAX protease family)
MWACFITVAAARIPANSPLGFLLLSLGVFAPSLVALGLTAGAEGLAGVRALLGRIVQGPVAARWYIFALAYVPAIKLAAAAIHRVAIGAWPRFGDVPLYLIPLAILVSTPVQAGEEVGWRGYALPRMAERMGLAPASVLLGLLWAFWHLPQFFIREADTYGQSFLVYVLQVTALSVAMAWLFAKAGGSLLPVMLMHAAVNNAKDIVPSATPGASDPFGSSASLVAWLTVTLLWICAGAFLAQMPDVRFSNRAPGSSSRRLA